MNDPSSYLKKISHDLPGMGLGRLQAASSLPSAVRPWISTVAAAEEDVQVVGSQAMRWHPSRPQSDKMRRLIRRHGAAVMERRQLWTPHASSAWRRRTERIKNSPDSGSRFGS